MTFDASLIGVRIMHDSEAGCPESMKASRTPDLISACCRHALSVCCNLVIKLVISLLAKCMDKTKFVSMHLHILAE